MDVRVNSLSCFQKIKDDGILWKVNFVRFHQYFIDEVSTHKIKKIQCQYIESTTKPLMSSHLWQMSKS